MLGEDSGIEVAALGGGPASRRRAGRERRPSRAARASSTASTTGAPATSASSSRSRPDGEELRGTGILEGRIADRAARRARASATTRSSSPTARSGRSPSSATTGSAANSHRARAARRCASAVDGSGEARRPPPSCAARCALAPPVHLGAEDDHVRHHVEPDEQEHRAAERLQRDDVARETRTKIGSTWKVASSSDRGEDRARAAPRAASARRSSAGSRRRRGRRRRRSSRRRARARRRRARCRRSPARSAAAGRRRASRASERRRRASTSEPTMSSDRERLPAQERAVRPAVDDVERRLEHAEERERRPEQEDAADRSRASPRCAGSRRRPCDDVVDRLRREDAASAP